MLEAACFGVWFNDVDWQGKFQYSQSWLRLAADVKF
jgi:hypothetical protein